MSQPLRILLADDHVLFRKGMVALISARPDMQVVGQASNGLQAIELARTTEPDVVLLDLHMPLCTGLEAIPQILADVPSTRIVMLTVSEDDRDLLAAIRSGAFGYLLKDLEPQQLFDFLLAARRGESPLAGAMTGKVLQALKRSEPQAESPAEMQGALTAREAQVLQWVAKGATNREIAVELSITENTVKIHLRNIFDKLHFQNRTQATAYAVRQGLVNPRDPVA